MVPEPVELVEELPDCAVGGREEVWVWRLEGVEVEVVRVGGCLVKYNKDL